MSLVPNTWIFDSEVCAHDWLFVFKSVDTGERVIIHNDNDAVKAFMENDPFLGGFNNKHYDNHILKGVLIGCTPEQIKEINDSIIVKGINGWDIPVLRECRFFFNSFDLMDDCQDGISLKAIEAHLGMPIEETEVDFNLPRAWNNEELLRMVQYCCYDVDATELLYKIRDGYLRNKANLAEVRGIDIRKGLYYTNAKMTAVYLQAVKPNKEWTDEREYKYPKQLLREYIPNEVFDFFDRMKDESLSNKEVFSSELEITVGNCPTKIAYGGIHGAIPTYSEEATLSRTIRIKDVVSYYANLMRKMGYCSRNMPSPQIYANTIDQRVKAKKAGDKDTANALKLVLNTTYGAMLNGKNGTAFNDLYDPLMGRSVCITGQLFLLELAMHLLTECSSLTVIQLNTDGIMVSFDKEDEKKWQKITQEWEERTGFMLEEDYIRKIVQKDVNNYIEIPANGGTPKIKGGLLVRGVLTNGNIDFTQWGFPAWENLNGGAWKINNNAVIIARAIQNYFVDGISPEQTIANSNNILEFQIISKVGHKYKTCYHVVNGENVTVQRVNRVYATSNTLYGTLYKVHATTDGVAKVAGLPTHCIVDNDNELTVDVVDRKWYIRQAKKYINDFLGVKPKRVNTRRINTLKKESIKLLGGI